MNQAEIYAAIGTVVVSILSGIIIASMSAGRMDARITALEEAKREMVGQAEWRLFLQELRDRLARIETKIDRNV